MTSSPAYLCPRCGAAELRIRRSLELGADGRSDEVTLQAAACGACGLLAAAVYEESRRGSLDSEAWSYVGYRLPQGRAAELLDLVERCPRPRDPRCTCPAHGELRLYDDTGRWAGLRRWGPGETFPLRPAE